MARKERPLDEGDSPLLRFAADLRALRRAAGMPTYRRLGALTHYSAATLSDAAGGRKLPTLDVTLSYVRAFNAAATMLTTASTFRRSPVAHPRTNAS